MPRITHRDCRALRHAMERMDEAGPDVRPPPSTPIWDAARYIICLRCYRCQTWRFVAIDRRGGMLASCYRWPEDYLLPKGEPKVAAETLRLWLAKPPGKA